MRHLAWLALVAGCGGEARSPAPACQPPGEAADLTQLDARCPQPTAVRTVLGLACAGAPLPEVGAALAEVKPALETACPGATRLLETGGPGYEVELARLCGMDVPPETSGPRIIGAALLRKGPHGPAWAAAFLRHCR